MTNDRASENNDIGLVTCWPLPFQEKSEAISSKTVLKPKQVDKLKAIKA